jgi:hypothetical protein
MTPETPDFATQARALAQALKDVYPDLSFEKDPDANTVTIHAGGLTLVVAPIPTATPLQEGTGSFKGRAGAYKGEAAYVNSVGAQHRQAYRDDKAFDATVDSLKGMDFDAVAPGEMSGAQYKALCNARIQAQNRIRYGQPTDEQRALYDHLHERWVAEYKAQQAKQAQQPGPTLGGSQAPVNPKGYEGD